MRFLTGTQGLNGLRFLHDEAAEYGDVVMLEHVDDAYRHLTAKVQAGLAWVHGHFDAQYVMKVRHC